MAQTIEKLVEELGIDKVTADSLKAERVQLERRFYAKYTVYPDEIDALIEAGTLGENELVQDWLEMRAIEPYVPPKETSRRRSPANQADGRESGPFYFRFIRRNHRAASHEQWECGLWLVKRVGLVTRLAETAVVVGLGVRLCHAHLALYISRIAQTFSPQVTRVPSRRVAVYQMEWTSFAVVRMTLNQIHATVFVHTGVIGAPSACRRRPQRSLLRTRV